MNKSFSVLAIDSIAADIYRPELYDTAQLRQTVTTEYPAVQIKAAALDLFGAAAFGPIPAKTYDSVRVSWLQVPKGTTAEELAAKLQDFPNAGISRKLSNNFMDVLTDGQKAMIASGQKITSKDGEEMDAASFFEQKLRVRDTNGNELDGPAQYAQNFFETVRSEDFDNRTFKGSNATGNTQQEVDAFAATEQLAGAAVEAVI